MRECGASQGKVRVQKKAARAALAVAVSGALVALVIAQLDLAEATARFRAARPGWLAAAALASFSVLLLRGARFTTLGRHAGFGLTTAATAIQNFLNRVTPLRLGELSLPWLLRRHAGEDAARAVLSVVLVRVIDLTLVLAAVALGLALRDAGEGAPPLLPTVAALAAFCVLLAAFRPLLRAGFAAARVVAGITGLGRVPAVGRAIDRLHAAVAGGEALSRGQLARVAACSLGIYAGQMTLFYALLAAFEVEVGFLELLQGGAVAMGGAAVPIAAVGSIGTQEAAWVAGFAWVGVPLQDALVTAVACQLITLAFAGIFALPAWLWLARLPRAGGDPAPPLPDA